MPKFFYFGVPGRGEGIRMLFALGQVPYEEVTMDGSNWAEYKLKMPSGTVPAVQLEDGRMLAQSGAVERYVGKLAGLYPEDPVDAAFADQGGLTINDAFEIIMATLDMPVLSEKILARQTFMKGTMKAKLLLFTKLLEGRSYFAGDKMAWSDVVLFGLLSAMRGGDFEGIPRDYIEEYPVLKAYHTRIASHPILQAKYANAVNSRVAFQPISSGGI